MSNGTGTVWVDHHLFTLGDISTYGNRAPQPPGQATGLIMAAQETWAFVTCGISLGFVSVAMSTSTVRPPDTTIDGWEDVAEVSLSCVIGPLKAFGDLEGTLGDSRLDADAPACYRVRVHARGRDVLYDGVALVPVEDYLLLAWLEPFAPKTLLKSSSQCGAQGITRGDDLPGY